MNAYKNIKCFNENGKQMSGNDLVHCLLFIKSNFEGENTVCVCVLFEGRVAY